jgi:hypothetical protein
MKNLRWLGIVCVVGASALPNAGCVAHAQATGVADADAPVVFTEAPTLVEVDGESIWVVRDCDQAVYYVDDYYWVYRGEKWHRSRSYDGGWAVVEVNVVPAIIVHRDHFKYVHYHGAATARTRLAPRDRLASSDDHGGDKHGGPDHDKDKLPGPPDHAGGPHDGPPGHDDIPGVGNQRKAEDGNAANFKKEGEKRAEKKNEKKKKDDKKK